MQPRVSGRLCRFPGYLNQDGIPGVYAGTYISLLTLLTIVNKKSFLNQVFRR